MTEQHYRDLYRSGMLFEFYPECTGNWQEDKYAVFGYGDNDVEQREPIR